MMKKMKFVLAACAATFCTAQAMAAIPHYSDISSAQHYTGNFQYRGVNLAGAAFKIDYKAAQEAGLSGDDPFNFVPVADDATLFQYQGMNAYRLPLAWEHTGTQTDPFGFVEYPAHGQGPTIAKNYMDTVAALAATPGSTVIIDMHNYMHYNGQDNMEQDSFPTNSCYIGQKTHAGCPAMMPEDTDLANWWQEVTEAVDDLQTSSSPIKGHVMFELMNEPQGKGLTAQQLADAYIDVIQAIRKQEGLDGVKPHTIVLDGLGYSGLHSWDEKNDGANDWLLDVQNKTLDKNLLLDVHQYFDADGSFSGAYSTGACGDYTQAIPTWLNAMNTYSQKHNNIKYILGEFGAPYYTPGADIHAMSPNTSCIADIKTMLADLNPTTMDAKKEATSYAAGALVWSGGHAFPADTKTSIGPGACFGNAYMYAHEEGSYLDDKFISPLVGHDIKGFTAPERFNVIHNQSSNPIMVGNSYSYPLDYSQPTCLAWGANQDIPYYPKDANGSTLGDGQDDYQFVRYMTKDTHDNINDLGLGWSYKVDSYGKHHWLYDYNRARTKTDGTMSKTLISMGQFTNSDLERSASTGRMEDPTITNYMPTYITVDNETGADIDDLGITGNGFQCVDVTSGAQSACPQSLSLAKGATEEVSPAEYGWLNLIDQGNALLKFSNYSKTENDVQVDTMSVQNICFQFSPSTLGESKYSVPLTITLVNCHAK